MEPANPHHHHHLHHSSSLSPSTSPSCYGLGSTHANWSTQPTIPNPSSNGLIINSWDTRQLQNDFLSPPTIQDLSINNDLHLARMKGEMGIHSYQKFAQMMHSLPSCIEDFRLKPKNYMKNDNGDHHDMISGFGQKALLRSFSSGSQIGGGNIQLPATEFSHGVAAASRGSFSQIFPTINISKLHQSSSLVSTSLGMELEYPGQISHDFNLRIYRDGLCYGLHTQQPSHMPSDSPSNASPFMTGEGAEAKRPAGILDQVTTQQPAPKKPRPESRTCPPFKVRKEKLGDRIAALQQLVAPFGKTDTASVLMEAIGYIKFLQSQVETLSVPYMKSSRNKTGRNMPAVSGEDGGEGARRDLRSLGLCLMPLSCISYVTEGGGGLWPPS